MIDRGAALARRSVSACLDEAALPVAGQTGAAERIREYTVHGATGHAAAAETCTGPVGPAW